MACTVKDAFSSFRGREVDLSPEATKTARSSRDFLMQQIKGTAEEDETFPKLCGSYIPFGSFARSTKTRPLDDIDLLLLLNGKDTESKVSTNDNFTYWLKIKDSSAPLASFPDSYNYVNSTKVLNKIKGGLSDVRKYKNADIKKNMEAVTLSLPSYDWVFDIVPAVPVDDGKGGIAYYLIPNGTGDWKRTDPRIDAAICSQVNERHQKLFLPTVRLIKYWNQRPIAPALPSYYLETLALKVFSSLSPISLIRGGVEQFFQNVGTHLWASCPDPKQLGTALDADIAYDTKQKVAEAMTEAGKYAGFAMMYENQNNHKDAIYWWKRIYGERFPDYG